jgi:hypothetical protein
MKRISILIGVVALMGLGASVGFFARGSVVSGGSAKEASAAPTNNQRELAKLAVAASAVRRSLDQQTNEPTAEPAAAPAPVPAPQAGPDRTPAARAERDGQVEKLQASGSAPPEFATGARAVESDVRALARSGHVAVDATPWNCYKAGCFSTTTFKDGNDLDEFAAKLSQEKGLRAWPGGSFRSGPIVTASGTEITWVLFAPEASDGT